MNKKLSSLKRIVFGLKPFISPYKWEFAGAVLMVIISVVTMVSAPSVEGMITTQLASDLSLAESIGKLQVNFDEITKIIPLSLLITVFIVRHSQKRFKAQQDALGALNGAITELYTGYNEILLFNKQQQSIEKFRNLNENLRQNACTAQFVSSTIGH